MNKVIPLPNCATSTEEWGLFMKTLSALRFEFVGRKTDAREKAVQLLNKYQGQANVCAGPARHFAQLAVFELVELLEEFKYANLNNEDGPTGETATKPQITGPIARLYKAGRLADEHLSAALTIERLYIATTAPCMARIGRYDRGGGGKYEPLTEDLSLIRSKAYLPWLDELKESVINADMILGVVIDGTGLKETARRYKIPTEGLVEILRQWLGRFAELVRGK